MSKLTGKGLDGRHRNTDGKIQQKRGDTTTLGLRAFERISAVEGVSLSREMKRVLKSISGEHVGAAERSRFINDNK